MTSPSEAFPDITGRRSLPLEVCVTPRRAMNYAAGVQDSNPRYFDDERPSGPAVHPMLAPALTWPLSRDFAQYWPGTDLSPEALSRQMHYTEELRWRRPLRCGDVLQIQGAATAVLPHPSGVYLVLEYEARDAQGALVFTERAGGLFRGMRLAGKGRGRERLTPSPRLTESGPPVWTAACQLDTLASYVYDACAEISFPIHTSRRSAREQGLPGPILHGTATLAYAVRELVNREARGDPARLNAVQCRFTGMVFPGGQLAVRALKREKGGRETGIHFDVVNHQGGPVLTRGHAVVAKGVVNEQ